jgi:predicted DNA-binding transcriptional regulator YafY
MQPIGGKKAMMLCILKVLEDYSDFDHPMTQHDIIRHLWEDYGIEAGRNAVARNISMLCELGYDIAIGVEKGKGCYIRERDFDNMELLVLMDSVLTSRYIPPGNAQQMIEKLGQLSNRHFRDRLPQVHRMDDWQHQRNREFFYNLEILNDAIVSHRQVSFQYNRPQEDGLLHPVRSRKDTVHPFALVCANAQYYLIACYRGSENFRHFRVDRMTQVEMLNEPARSVTEMPGCEEGLNIAKYASEHNLMYGGKAERIVLKMRRECAGDILDAFGNAASMRPLDDAFMEVVLHAASPGMRYFALQFAPVCEVIEPKSLRETLLNDAKDMERKYEA